MSKLEPKNRKEAFCYQFEDDIKLLKSFALLDDQNEYLKQLGIIEMHIKNCKELIKNEKQN